MTGTNTQWLIAPYQPSTFFTLKPASATSSGGKSLLLPTPFAIKMALLDAALRTQGKNAGAILFPQIKNLRIAIKLPDVAVVNNTFVKILRPHKSGVKVTGTGLQTPMGNTIAFREYVSYHGEMALAFQGMLAAELTPLLLNVNYFGKRGGFFQLTRLPETHRWTDETLAENGYTLLTQSTTEAFNPQGILQMVDDCGEKMTFEHADIYSGKKITLGKERILHHVILPYRLEHSSKSYSYFKRI